jgi:hypothetical protein
MIDKLSETALLQFFHIAEYRITIYLWECQPE